MATLCANCGATLKDDARFCNNCGILVPSHPFSPKSTSSSASPVAPVEGQDKTRVVLREQIAQQPPTRSARYSNQDQPPSWMNQLDRRPHPKNKVSPAPLSKVESSSEERIEALPTKALNEERIDDLPTRPLIASSPVYRSTQTSTPSYSPAVMQVQPQSAQEQGNASFIAAPGQGRSHTPPAQTSMPTLAGRKQRKSGKPLAMALITLLLLVLVGGIVAWVVLFQPFSVPGITQPQQSFKDTQLGVSLSYPSGWQFQIDRRNATVHFYDSSHTAQVNLVVGPANGGDVGQYLKQQANQLGMTNQKTGVPLSFAGTTWQQIQGSVQQRGASYSETLLVTVHNQHLFTLIQLAPQTTYASEEQLVFSSMRSSLQFV